MRRNLESQLWLGIIWMIYKYRQLIFINEGEASIRILWSVVMHQRIGKANQKNDSS